MSLFWSQELRGASAVVLHALDVQVACGEELAAVEVRVLPRPCLEDVARQGLGVGNLRALVSCTLHVARDASTHPRSYAFRQHSGGHSGGGSTDARGGILGDGRARCRRSQTCAPRAPASTRAWTWRRTSLRRACRRGGGRRTCLCAVGGGGVSAWM